MRSDQSDLGERKHRTCDTTVVGAYGCQRELGAEKRPHDRSQGGQRPPDRAVPRRCCCQARLCCLRGDRVTVNRFQPTRTIASKSITSEI